MLTEIVIRRAESIADYQSCQEAQWRAWGLRDEGYVVPIATMVGAQLHGGLLLGAFLPSGEAVGVSFGFLGRIEGRLCLYSQLTGVVPGYQDRGLGSRLKQAQRTWAWAEGIGCIAWAFDPLQAGNAHFNLEKLGATAVRYLENMYGPRTDALNAGVPTDRLIALWETDPDSAPRPSFPLDLIPNLPRWIEPIGGNAVARGIPPTQAWALIPIPVDIATLRHDAPDLAERWRQAVRGAFLQAFRSGYVAIGFARDAIGPLPAYLLHRPARLTAGIAVGDSDARD